jgi:phosphatidylglycerol:prolipoprotein diacylglycerol transferase
VAWYGLGRAIIEGLRVDSLYWGPFRVSQMLALVSCVAAVIVLAVMALRKKPHTLYVDRVNKT